MIRSLDDESLARVTFRLCRFMLARKVLWDENCGFQLPELARALTTPEPVIEEIVTSLAREGWVTRCVDDDGRLMLTERGAAEILGRAVDSSKPAPQSGSVSPSCNGSAPSGAIGAIGAPAEELLGG